MLKVSDEFRRRVAQRLAPPMFCCSMLFLAVIATIIVLCVDVPHVERNLRVAHQQQPLPEAGSLSSEEDVWSDWESQHPAVQVGYGLFQALLCVWPLFLLELLLEFLTHDPGASFWRRGYYGLLICLCPPLRMCARNHDMEGKIWLPWLGWQAADDALRIRLERVFSIPMIVIASMILPVLLVEFGLTEQVANHRWLRILLHVGTGTIWFAFAAEFIVMVSVADEKLRYCRQHWVDLAIILFPLISFLRSLRMIRAMRVARLARVEQLTRMTRLYRLRGLSMRGLRALLLLELLNRMLGVKPEKRLRKLERQLREKEQELAALRSEIEKVQQQIAELA